MMVMWSTHDGLNDESGQAVVSYMTAAEFEKALPDGERVLEVREPPPELLAGDPVNMRRAIKAVPFKRRYASAVLSFHRDDIDVIAFNAGDAEASRQVAEVIEAFEATAFSGIDPADRPPMLWTTHTHTGRLELNFVCPRAILVGDKLRSINPNPPGQENRATWDSFRDVFNLRYGWADPDDPARKRLVAVPDHLAKANALRERMGQVAQRDGREVIAGWIAQRIEAGAIQNRSDVVAQLREQGFEINREGKEYVSVRDPGSGARYRLRGPIFSSSFTSLEALGAAGGRGAPRDRGDLARALPKAEQQLAQRLEKRARFNRERYQARIDQKRAEDLRGSRTLGPGSPPSPVVEFHHGSGRSDHGHADDGLVRLRSGQGSERAAAGEGYPEGRVGGSARIPHQDRGQVGHLGPDQPARNSETGRSLGYVGQGSIAPWYPRGRGRPEFANYKAMLWASLYDAALPQDLPVLLLYVDTAAQVVRLIDGSEVQDHGDRISATGRTTTPAVRLMLAEARAKGWESISLEGNAEFKSLVAAEAVKFGLSVAGSGLLDTLSFSPYSPRPEADAEDLHHARPGQERPDPVGTRAEEADRGAERFLRDVGGGIRGTPEGREGVKGDGRGVTAGQSSRADRKADEIERIKLEADLRAVAAWLGFQEDRRASDQNHTAMRLGDRKIIIGINRESGHWCWSDNQGRHGTAIDLVQQIKGGSLGDVRRHLRQFIGQTTTRPRIDAKLYEPRPKPRPAKADAAKARAEWEAGEEASRSVFLEKSRGLDPEVLAAPRFAGCFRVDERHNAVFPYFSRGELVAVERRNRAPKGSERTFKSYTAGAAPGVWRSNSTAADTRLVVVESSIDAMSFHALQGDDQTRYLALRQGYDPGDLAEAIRAMPAGALIVAATDDDVQGRKYAQEVILAAREAGYAALEIVPEGKDWNEDLVNRQGDLPGQSMGAF